MARVKVHGNAPVSYTHLDVYKRQAVAFAVPHQGAASADRPAADGPAPPVRRVSPDHLPHAGGAGAAERKRWYI